MPRFKAHPIVPFASRPICLALSLLVALAGAQAHASPAGPAIAVTEPAADPAAAEPVVESPAALDDPAVALSRAHFRSGLEAYEAGDYTRAIESWSQAYQLMGTVPAMFGPRHVLELDLGKAHLRAYDRDGDARHLTSARVLLESYVGWVDRPAHELTVAEREDRPRAVEMLARIDIETPRPRADVPAPRVAPSKRAAPPIPIASPRASKGMIIGGSVTLGVAVLAAATLGVFGPRAARIEYEYEHAQAAALERDPSSSMDGAPFDDLEREGRVNNAAFIAMASISVVALVTGASLLTAGLISRKRHRASSPNVARLHGGTQLGFRF